MTAMQDHPLRYAVSNELHARPFSALGAPGRVVYLAIKRAEDVPGRDVAADRAHLLDLLDRFGAAHPQPGATHFSGQLGQHLLKWEQHTEFVTYTMFLSGRSERPFDPADFDVFPADWLADAPGVRITSASIRICLKDETTNIPSDLADWFVADSLAVSTVLDEDAQIAGDFRIDPAGHVRFALFVAPDVGERRIGRIAQRLCEIEAYKTMSMLGFVRVREVSGDLGKIDGELTRLITEMSSGDNGDAGRLEALLDVSAQLESLTAGLSFRLSATRAYEALVHQRIEVLRETRFAGRQTFSEFMTRRYDPAMRTVQSTEKRLAAMTERASRASDLLRTRVEVMRSALNQGLLEAMNSRSEAQLQLQKTVEGLSVVAISYYAVSLAAYLLAPAADVIGLTKTSLVALVTVPVVLFVWFMIRRIRSAMERS